MTSEDRTDEAQAAKAGLAMNRAARIGRRDRPAKTGLTKTGLAKTRMCRVRATIGCNST